MPAGFSLAIVPPSESLFTMKTITLLFLMFSAAGVRAAEPLPHQSGDLSLRNEVTLAIDKGLAWLQKAQNADGSWSLPDQPALTALPLTAFMLEPTGKFRKERPIFVNKGYDFIVASAKPDGGIFRKGLANYNTSLSLNALAAAGDPSFAKIIASARQFVIGQQAHGMTNSAMDGGMGYGPTGTHGGEPDLSNTVMALDALYHSKTESTQELGNAKDLDWKALTGFLQRCQNLPAAGQIAASPAEADNNGGFVYAPGASKAPEINLPNGKKALRSYGSMSYAGLLSYIYADFKKDDPRVQAVVDWLQRHYTLEENPGMGGEGLYYYYHLLAKAMGTYGTNELTMADGRKVDWRKELAKKLIDVQKGDGSWLNEKGRWMEKDPVLVTCYAVMALEIVHRAL